MTSLNPWTRLEPAVRDTTLARGLRHELRDPVWLLGRQLQVGEFTGTDGGTPIRARPVGRTSRLDRVRHPGDDAWQPYDPDTSPLDPVVERRPAEDPTDLLQVLALCRELETLLLEAGANRGLLNTLRARLPLGGTRWPAGVPTRAELPRLLRDRLSEPRAVEELRRLAAPQRSEHDLRRLITATQRGNDRAVEALLSRDTRLVEVLLRWVTRPERRREDTRENSLEQVGAPADLVAALTGTLLDAWAVARLLRAGQDALAVLDEGRNRRHREIVSRALEAFAARLETGPDGEAAVDRWDPRTLGYEARFGTAEGDEVAVTGHRGGDLDWPDLTLTATGSGASTPLATDEPLQPVPLAFTGLRPDRWWELAEDRLDLDTLQSDPEDLATLLVREFTLRARDTWSLAVLPLELGTVCVLEAVEITDTFGHTGSLVAERRWDTFGPAPAGNAPVTVLVVPPTAMDALEAPAAERVHLLVDHAAQLGWAGEEVVADHLGLPRHREDLHGAVEPDEPETLTYRLRSAVPTAWFPLAPGGEGQAGGTERLHLRLLTGQGAAGVPRSRLLEEDFDIDRDRIPDSGRRLELLWRSARWRDGRLHTWLARRVRDTSTQRPPALRYDRVWPL